jgi:type IV secretion system protein TrbL
MIFTGIITALAFIAITVQFVVAMVESYIIVAAGFIFVGFGGSRWTAPYVERYIGLGVATGVKIMLLYLLIGTGMNLSVDWMTDAQNIASNSSPAMSALEIMGASIIFMMLCWQIPKLFAAVLGGSPALSGGDLVSSGAFVAGGGMAVSSMALGAAAGATGLLSSGAAGGATSAGFSSAGSAPPAMLASAGSKGGGSGTVPPPTSPSSSPSSGPSQPAAPLSDAARNLSGMQRRISSQVPPDAGPHATPPRLNIDNHE